MPQVLKEDVRNRIIESAKKEFMQKGYEKTNMRSIAHNCSMTVGNVYRYFKNKEELSKYIVSNVVDKIDIMVKELTDNEIELLVFNMNESGNIKKAVAGEQIGTIVKGR